MENEIVGFVQTVRRRNIRESLAAAALAGLFVFGLFSEPYAEVVTVGRVLVVSGALGVLCVIWGRLSIPASELRVYPPAQHSERWRRRMTTQARWLRFAWLWYVLPPFVGIELMMLGSSTELSVGDTVAVLVVAILGAGIGLLNVQAAKQMSRRRDAWLGGEDAA